MTFGEPASARIVHLRMATPGSPVEVRNTHPFLADGIAFAHNGAILPRKRLRMLLSPAYTGQLEGTTDSELFFALIRQRAHDLDDTFGGVCSAVASLRREFPDASLNALLLTSEQMIAVHSSEHATVPTDHFTATGLRLADLPPDHLERYFRMFYLREPDGSTAFASTGIGLDRWTPHFPRTVSPQYGSQI